MRARTSPSRHAFTLLELLAAVLVMSIIAAVLMPIITSASQVYTQTRRVRTGTEHVAFAIDRVTRILREAPIGPGDSGIGVASATPTRVAFTDGTGFQLSGSTLEMLLPAGGSAPLCEGVDDVVITYLASDGVSDTSAAPALTQRFVVTITSGQVEMSVLVFPRVWIGQEDA